MKKPSVVQFYIQSDPDGGYTAEAVGFSIYTQGDTLDEVVKNIKEAVDCHFAYEKISESLPIMVNFALPTFA